MSGPVLRDIDRGWGGIVRELKKSQRHRVAVGVLGSTDGRDDEVLSNALLAAVHEFGSADGHIPERSFLRSTLDRNIQEYRALARKLMSRVALMELTTEQALAFLGERVVNDVRLAIREGIDPELKEATKNRKGSSTPLVDTAQLLGSLTREVRRA